MQCDRVSEDNNDKKRKKMGVRSGPRIPSESREEGGVLLIHSDTTNGSTSFVDSSPSAHAITNYDVIHSTTKSKFGATSLFMSDELDRLRLADSPDWDFGTEDWTIDCWVNPTTAGNSPYGWGGIVTFTDTGKVTSPFLHNLRLQLTSRELYLGTSGGNIVTSSTVPLTTWTHVAAVRSGDSIKLYINGVLGATSTGHSGQNHTSNGGGIEIGSSWFGYSAYYWDGYIDEFRISKGIARWTENFKPPHRPYITRDLVLCLDAMNAKSFAGEPTTNLVTDGDCNDGSGPDNMSFGYEGTVTVVDCPTDDMGFKPSAKTMKIVKNSGTNGRISFFGSLGSLSTGSGNPYTASCWFYIPRTSTGTGGTGGVPRWSTDNTAGSVNLAYHRTYHQDDKGTWVKVISEWYSVAGSHSHGLRVVSGDPVGAVYYMTEVQVEKKDHSTPFVDGARPVADAWKDLSGNDNHGTFSAEDFGAASEDYFLVRKGGILLPASTALSPQINNPTGGGGLRANPDFPASINFDGTGDYVDIGSVVMGEVNSVATFCAWVSPSTTSGTPQDGIMGEYVNGFIFATSESAYGDIKLYDGTTNHVSSGGFVLGNVWSHCVITWQASGRCRIYHNGQEVYNAAVTATSFGNSPTNTRIGSVGGDYGSSSAMMNGKIATVQLYKATLTAVQVKDMYNSQRSRFGL
jgi:hypothetical protein